jgi:predicted secreted Zn-dependent protease
MMRYRRWWLILLAMLLLLPAPSVDAQAAPPSPPAPEDALTFSETPYWLAGDFRAYWEANGGLERFGFPITPLLIDGRGDTVQWLERARFEYHDQLPDDRRVLLGLLGVEVAAGREGEPAFQRVPNPDASGGQWFQETGHTLGGLFQGQWRAGGGLPVYGFPISEVFDEVNPADGQTYAVQYFERNRFELHHREDGGEFVQFGLLGQQRYPGGGVAARVVPGEPGGPTPDLKLSTTFRYYTITGATGQQLRQQMDQRGPVSDGKRWAGLTEQQYRWEVRYTTAPNRCAVQSVTISVQTTITLPRWEPPPAASPELRQEWIRFINALALHEDGHRQIGLTGIRQLREQARALSPAPACQALSAALEQAAKETSDWIRRENIRYDQETDHGRTQGT